MRRVRRSELLEHLSRGVEHWNHWRKENRTVWPDLIELKRGELPDENLRGIDLENANLLGSNLRGCCLAAAELRNSNLKDAILVDTDFRGANLQEANLHNADLRGADLRSTKLHHANLSRTKLSRTRFDRAVLQATSLDGTSLADTRGFERVFIYREGPAPIGIDTLQKTLQDLEDRSEKLQLFYRVFSNFGVPHKVLNLYVPQGSRPPHSRRPFLRRLISRMGVGHHKTQGQPWRSCFLSYSHHDTTFASRLDRELRTRNVPVFYAPRSSQTSAVIENEVETNIALSDRVLVVCSQAALSSEWVGREVDFALLKADATEDNVLVPVDLDGRVFSSSQARAVQLRERVAADFQDWQVDSKKFARSFDKLLSNLRLQSR